MWNCHSWPLDMPVAMWNCHSWALHVSSNVKLPFWTTRCQYWGNRSTSRSRGWSAKFEAKFELILTSKCQCWGVDLPADLGVDLPSLNSSWPLDVSNNVKLPFLTTRHVSSNVKIAILYHYMSVPMRNCHSWPLDVSSNGGEVFQLPFLTTRCQYQCEIAILDH